MCSSGWCVCGLKRFFLWLLMYWANWNLRSYRICASVVCWVFLKWFDSLWWISSLKSHLSTYVYFMAHSLMSLLGFVFMNVGGFLIMHVKLVLEGDLARLYGMVWATCMRGMGVMVLFEVPSFASESAMSFPSIPMWALIFPNFFLCQNHVMCWTIDVISNLSGWLC